MDLSIDKFNNNNKYKSGMDLLVAGEDNLGFTLDFGPGPDLNGNGAWKTFNNNIQTLRT
jgi:hypothetical protein